jgi:MFS family permease
VPHFRYITILRPKGTARLLVSALAARIPDSIAATGIVVLVHSTTGSYRAAGVAAAAFGLGTAVSAPLAGRALDRLGQRRVLPVLAVAFAPLSWLWSSGPGTWEPVAWLSWPP